MEIHVVRRSDETVVVPIPGHPTIEGTVPVEFVAEVIGAGLANLERVRLRIAVRDGQSECTGLYLVALEGAVVGQADLKRVSLRKLVDAAVASVAEATLWVQTDEDGDGLDMPLHSSSWYIADGEGGRIDPQRLMTEALRPRRRTVTPEFLESVAEVYLADTTGMPTKAVQKGLNGSHSSAARWVSLARDAGLIPPAERKKSTKETER